MESPDQKIKVVEISAVKRRKNFLRLHFEEGEPLELHMEVVARHRIFRDTVLDAERMERIIAEDEGVRCREAAWRLLSVRPRSRMELVRALRQRRFMKPTVERIAEDLVAKGFVNDEAFAKQFAEERTRRRHGPRLIEQELRARGVEREAAKDAARQFSDSDSQQEDARELLRKWNRRTKPEDPRKRRMAAAQFLVRRGYDQDMVWDAVREVMGGEEDP